MKDLYLAIRNSIIFFFITILAGAAITLPVGFAEKIFLAIIFGSAVTLIPHILKFFKLPVNTGSLLLMSTIVTFIFFVVMSYFVILIQFSGRLPDLFIFFGLNASTDKLMSVVYITLISSLVIVGFDTLEKNA